MGVGACNLYPRDSFWQQKEHAAYMTQDTHRCTLVVISPLYARNGEARDHLCEHWSKATKESASQIQLDVHRSFQKSIWMFTFRMRTSAVSGHLVIVPAIYKHCILNLPLVDTSLDGTFFLVTRVLACGRFKVFLLLSLYNVWMNKIIKKDLVWVLGDYQI